VLDRLGAELDQVRGELAAVRAAAGLTEVGSREASFHEAEAVFATGEAFGGYYPPDSGD
jgi:hypothetical protein